MELKWVTEVIPSSGGNTFFEEFDLKKYAELVECFNNLSPDVKSHYKGMEDYIVKEGGPNLNSNQKNYKKINDEITSTIQLY